MKTYIVTGLYKQKLFDQSQLAHKREIIVQADSIIAAMEKASDHVRQDIPNIVHTHWEIMGVQETIIEMCI